MRMRYRIALGAALALAAAGCGESISSVTYPGYDGHAQFFPLAGSSHEGVDCNSCHGAYDTFQKFDCTTCHTKPQTDPTHQGISGYSWESASCYRCHPNGSIPHLLFPIGPKTKHASNCTGCHGTGSRTVVGNLQCASCHAGLGVNAQHGQVRDYQASSPMCLRCHDQSKVWTVASHPSGEDTFKGNRHHPANCLECHPGVLATPRNSAAATWAADWNSRGCNSCHSGGFGD